MSNPNVKWCGNDRCKWHNPLIRIAYRLSKDNPRHNANRASIWMEEIEDMLTLASERFNVDGWALANLLMNSLMVFVSHQDNPRAALKYIADELRTMADKMPLPASEKQS